MALVWHQTSTHKVTRPVPVAETVRSRRPPRRSVALVQHKLENEAGGGRRAHGDGDGDGDRDGDDSASRDTVTDIVIAPPQGG